MSVLPNSLRSVLRIWDRYIDYVGNKSDATGNCSTVTKDALSLLAEYEIFGARNGANQYEQNHQKQMAYYINGNSKVKYRHDATGTACIWWEASPFYSSVFAFCYVLANGTFGGGNGRYDYALSPAFKT